LGLFVVLYWLIPGLLDGQQEAQSGNPYLPILDVLYERRERLFRWAGIAILIASLMLALWNYLAKRRMREPEQSATGFLAKFLARFFD
jgi:hypothetical protein